METKLVVIGIPWDVDTDGLRQYMSKFGELDDCIVMKEISTGRSCGFGYVTFASADDAKKVLENDEHVLGNRTLEVKVATPKLHLACRHAMATGEAGSEVPCIKAPEALCTITELFLWDDVKASTSDASALDGSCGLEVANSCITVDKNSRTDHSFNEYISVEELELAQQMDSLGLPLSFGTSKARKNVISRAKRKAYQLISVGDEKETNNLVPQVMECSQMDGSASSGVLHDSTNISSCLCNMEGQNNAAFHNAKEDSRCNVHSNDSTSLAALGSRNEAVEKPVGDELSDAYIGNYAKLECTANSVGFGWKPEVLTSLSFHGDNSPEDSFKDASTEVQFLHDGDLLNKQDLDKCSDDSFISCCDMHPRDGSGDKKALHRCSISADSPLFYAVGGHVVNDICEFGEWRVIWDPFYKMNYFFNAQSQESTWYPPSGLEKYAFSCSNLNTEEILAGEAEKKGGSGQLFGFNSDATDSFQENGSVFQFINEQPVEMSAKKETRIDSASLHMAISNGNSDVQLSHPSGITDVMKVLQNNDMLLMPEKSQVFEENDYKNMDKQEEQLYLSGAYYGSDDCLVPMINEDGNAFNFSETYMGSSVDGLDTCQGNTVINKKKRVRRPQSKFKVQGHNQRLSNNLVKYWCQRYSLFSRFDDGIKMDEEGWFSVTPELIAKHHAFRCGGGTIIDCFTGAGGNAIQFAMRSNHVIAIDVDPLKIDYAHHNAVIYGVSEKIDFVKGDFFEIAPRLKGDVVFLSPPWGGPQYSNVQTYDMRSLKPREGSFLFKIARMIASKVVMFLPRNVNLNQLAELSLSADPPWSLEVEKNYLNGKLKSITAYFDKNTAE